MAMQTLAIALGSIVLYFVAYFTYGRWLGQKIFKLDPNTQPPSIALEDGEDYVPTNKAIVFGHHFTSIAGTGPIVGPALAVIWGWLPALLWVLFGSIFIGAVHDFGALVVSMRNQGKTVGDIAGSVISKRTRLLFLLILFLALTIVLAIFGLVIAKVFAIYPSSITPCIIQIPLALAIGFFVHKKNNSILIPSLISLLLMYLSVIYGDVGFLHSINNYLASWGTLTWVLALLIYSYIASVLPVWSLLQPRDYINSLQLLTALALVVVGLVVAAIFGGSPVEGARPALEIAAPMIEPTHSLKQLPLIFPFLFITIACGAISGFHCLVSSGTSSKQLRCETDARFVGYGSMLTEGFLAVLVILACIAGLSLGVTAADGSTLLGIDAWNAKYLSWASTEGLGSTVSAFVDGASNFLKSLGLSATFAQALMGVFVASFAATTLDTACRLQRYVVQELATTFDRPTSAGSPLAILKNKHGATIFAILIAFAMAAMPAKSGAPLGTGGLILWPLFGAINQLLGGIAFLVIFFWLRERKLPTWFILIPTAFMLILPAWAMLYQIFVSSIGADTSWIDEGRWLLVAIGLITIALEAWMIAEALNTFKNSKIKPSRGH